MTPDPDPPAQPDDAAETPRRRLPIRLSRTQEESLAERLAQQWALARAERRVEPLPIQGGHSNLAKAQVPYGVDLAAAWAWRFLVISAATYVVLWLLARFAVMTVSVAIALLIAALVSPVVGRLHRLGLPRGLAAGVVMVTGMTVVGLLLSFVGQQVAVGASDLADSVAAGLGKISDWLRDGPLQASEAQIEDAVQSVQQAITDSTREGGVLSRTLAFGTAVGHIVAGFFVILFATYFFLADGDRIWSWVVRLTPRGARERVDSSGKVAWRSLTQFVRATVLVAAVDAVGVMMVAAALGVPFVLALGVLVFLGAFVPMVGATVAGTIAVLVALVDQGPITALLMAGGVILVQQLEGHVLQPFLMGRFVSLHPLGVILAIGCWVLVAGIVGALIAVPLAAAGNAVVQHLASHSDGGDDPVEELEEDLDEGAADEPGGAEGDRPADS